MNSSSVNTEYHNALYIHWLKCYQQASPDTSILESNTPSQNKRVEQGMMGYLCKTPRLCGVMERTSSVLRHGSLLRHGSFVTSVVRRADSEDVGRKGGRTSNLTGSCLWATALECRPQWSVCVWIYALCTATGIWIYLHTLCGFNSKWMSHACMSLNIQ